MHPLIGYYAHVYGVHSFMCMKGADLSSIGGIVLLHIMYTYKFISYNSLSYHPMNTYTYFTFQFVVEYVFVHVTRLLTMFARRTISAALLTLSLNLCGA